ncbi:hypothetical protein SBOR_0558 [Sclerotinia borealis F-4128]|uniref:Peptidase M20 dimerisation domain-containing protein n=1 Tax=Sclerotinia borealis (strain F-4128) TaxID=1432307 RepID=W9CWL3_SCLBF|nr:hypothetical protein SBOR_0558 [Sclerotinia borealis F-4128]
MLAAAETLWKAKSEWQGTLVILFQPNEERGAGAKAMIQDGLYDPEKYACPIPYVVLGQHVMPYAAGQVGTRKGISGSAADSFRLTVYGKGGHASQPHMTIDLVFMAANIIVRLQGIISREVNPQDSAVITVGSVIAGMTENIIADEAVLKINVRNFNPETRERVLNSIKRVVKAECDASNTTKEPLFEPTSNFPFLINDNATTQKLSDSFDEVFGENHIQNCAPLGGSEDFGLLATEAPNKNGGKGVPSCYWLFGGTDPEVMRKAKEMGRLEDVPINHSPLFAPVIRPTLRTGVEALVTGALTFFKR